MSKAPCWNIEGDNAAESAKAIAQGIVTNAESFDKFVIGPGSHIGHEFSCHPPNGKRNLKTDHLKLNKRIQCWLEDKPHPDNRKREWLGLAMSLAVIIV